MGTIVFLSTYLAPIKVKTPEYNFLRKPIIVAIWIKNIFIMIKNRKKNIRKQFENQGPVFIKFAQWLSIRTDLLNPKQLELISTLQDKVPEHSFKYTKKVLKKEFGKNYQDVIKFISHKPIGSGSLAQVYHIKYKGKDAIIKVLHPQLDLKIVADLNFIFLVKKMAAKNKFVKIINQTFDLELFCKSIIDQIDLTTEASNLTRLSNDFNNNNTVLIPELYYSSKKIIIESYQEGIKYNQFVSKYPTRERETHTLISWVIRKMSLHTNFIHADLHHGNMLFQLKNNKVYLSLIDFGLVSNLDSTSQKYLQIFLKYLFFIDRSAEADLLESFNKNKTRSQEIKDIILSYIGTNEEEPIYLIKKNNITLKQILEIPDNILEQYIPPQITKSYPDNDNVIKELFKNGVCFDFFKLSTF